jgi:tetratricopeptide (TPR) repeat protein
MKRILMAVCLCVSILCACGQVSNSDTSNWQEQSNRGQASDPDVPTWQEQYDLGVRYLSEGNYKEAIIAFTAAIEIDPKQAPAYVSRGDAYVRSGETEANLAAAKADYEQAIELEKTNVEGYLGLADVYIRLGDFDKAEEILRSALEIIGENQNISNKLDEFSSKTITDALGRPRKTITRSTDGEVLSFAVISRYNSDGNAERIDYYDASGQLLDYEIDTYIQNGMRKDRYDSNGSLMYYSVHTDLEEGEFYSRVESYNADGILEQYTLYGHEKTQYFDADGTSLGYDTYEYNDAGQRTKWTRFFGNGELREYYVTEYDSDGNRTMHTCYDADGTVRSYIDYTESD